MKITKLAVLGIVITLMSAGLSKADPVLKGSFDGWGAGQAMTDNGGGHWDVTLTGLTPGSTNQFKVDTIGDWSGPAYPSQDVWARADGSGELTVHYYAGVAGDGWSPAADRVGYEDPGGLTAWSLAGDFNGWTDSAMTDLGGGLYSIDYNIATAGTYGWKFKDATTWDIAIAEDFGSWSANNSITTAADNTVVTFTLDLPNGRWMTIPEPATIGLLGVFGVGLIAARRVFKI